MNTDSSHTITTETEYEPTVKEMIEDFKDILQTIHNDKFFEEILSLSDSKYTKEEWNLALAIFNKR